MASIAYRVIILPVITSITFISLGIIIIITLINIGLLFHNNQISCTIKGRKETLNTLNTCVQEGSVVLNVKILITACIFIHRESDFKNGVFLLL